MDRICRITLAASAFVLSLAAAARSDVTQQSFFEAIESGRPEQVQALFSPTLADEVDEPVLAAWMQAINERLGSARAITTIDSPALPSSPVLRLTSARTTFERGSATSTLWIAEGRVQAFAVQSPDLGDDWFRGPTSTEFYRQQGEDLIRSVLAGDAPAACDRLHRSIRETIGRDGVTELVGHVADMWGPAQSVALETSRLDLSSESQRLILTYNVTSRRASGTCEVQIQFIGMKGHLMGFDFR